MLQGYDACTWESEQSPGLTGPEHVQLLLQLWERQRRAQAKGGEEARRAERAALQQAEQTPMQVDQQPPWVHGAPLLPHQLQAAAWLRASWLQRRPAVLADDQGLGKTASAVAYIASLLQELKATAPVLVVAPLATLSFWEGVCACDADQGFKGSTT